jgi:hypothetical protein
LSVTSNFGTNPCFLRSLRISRNAARLSRRLWTSMSRTSPSWSTARQRYIRFAGDPDNHLVQVPSNQRAGFSSCCHRSRVPSSQRIFHYVVAPSGSLRPPRARQFRRDRADRCGSASRCDRSPRTALLGRRSLRHHSDIPVISRNRSISCGFRASLLQANRKSRQAATTVLGNSKNRT